MKTKYIKYIIGDKDKEKVNKQFNINVPHNDLYNVLKNEYKRTYNKQPDFNPLPSYESMNEIQLLDILEDTDNKIERIRKFKEDSAFQEILNLLTNKDKQEPIEAFCFDSDLFNSYIKAGFSVEDFLEMNKKEHKFYFIDRNNNKHVLLGCDIYYQDNKFYKK